MRVLNSYKKLSKETLNGIWSSEDTVYDSAFNMLPKWLQLTLQRAVSGMLLVRMGELTVSDFQRPLRRVISQAKPNSRCYLLLKFLECQISIEALKSEEIGYKALFPLLELAKNYPPALFYAIRCSREIPAKPMGEPDTDEVTFIGSAKQLLEKIKPLVLESRIPEVMQLTACLQMSFIDISRAEQMNQPILHPVEYGLAAGDRVQLLKDMQFYHWHPSSLETCSLPSSKRLRDLEIRGIIQDISTQTNEIIYS